MRDPLRSAPHRVFIAIAVLLVLTCLDAADGVFATEIRDQSTIRNRQPPSAMILPRWVSALTGRLDVTIERLSIAQNEFDTVRLPIRFGEDELDVDGATAGFAGGRLQFDMRHDLTTLDTHLRLSARDLESAQWPVWKSIMAAPINIELDLTGTGLSSHELAASMRGEFSAKVGAGTLMQRSVAQAGKNLFAVVLGGINPFVTASGPLPMTCANAHLVIANGRAKHTEIAAFQTGNLVMSCDGSVDFGEETTDLVCRPSLISSSRLFVPTVVDTVDIRGSFAAPEVSVNKSGLLRQGVSLGGGGITTLTLPGLKGVFGGNEPVPQCTLAVP